MDAIVLLERFNQINILLNTLFLYYTCVLSTLVLRRNIYLYITFILHFTINIKHCLISFIPYFGVSSLSVLSLKKSTFSDWAFCVFKWTMVRYVDSQSLNAMWLTVLSTEMLNFVYKNLQREYEREKKTAACHPISRRAYCISKQIIVLCSVINKQDCSTVCFHHTVITWIIFKLIDFWLTN